MNIARKFIGQAVVLATALAVAVPAYSQQVWPTGNQVRIIVPFSPGGISDVPGRILTEHLGKQTGRTFILEHRPGAGGTLGTTALQEAPADGNTLLIVSSGATIAPSLYPDVAPDPRTELTPLGVLIDIPIAIMVPADSELESLEDFVAKAKAEPGKYAYGTGGVGSGNHLAAELFQDMADVELFHVPYAGASASTTGLLTGEVDLTFASIFEAAGQERSGMARILGVASTGKLERYPDVAVISDVVPGFEASNYFGLVGPKDLDPAIAAEIAAQLATVRENEDARKVADNAGLDLELATPEELQGRFDVDVPRYSELIERLDLSR